MRLDDCQDRLAPERLGETREYSGIFERGNIKMLSCVSNNIGAFGGTSD
jgi:hypothetical protein